MPDRKRCLMIGAGGFAGAWIRQFLPPFSDRMEIVGLVDINPEALGSSGDFLGLPVDRRFDDMQRAFDEVEADFCAIVIPPVVHEEAVAVESGTHILSEKPIADTWEACVRIYRAVTDAGLKMAVTQNYRYTPRILTFKQALDDGRIGGPRYIVGRFAADYRRRGAWGQFRHEIPHALLIEGSVHHFDQLRNLAGADCSTIAGWEWNPGHPSFDGECCGLYVMRMANGVKALYEGNCLEAGWQNSWHQEYYRAEGEDGALVLDRDGVPWVLEHAAGRGLKTEELPTARPQWDGHKAIVDQFLNWLDGGPEPPTSLRDNIKSAAVLFAAIEASESCQAVDVAQKAATAIGGS
ncbi:MAG: Gfo/Idh/MocA family protein [Armatimonadota bacterium]